MGAIERLLSRRRVMRGFMHGSAVTVALPFLDCFLDGNGAALADGTPKRVRFVHYFFGNGITSGSTWWPDQPGSLAAAKLPDQISAFEPVKDKINVFSHFNTNPDGRSNRPHMLGWQGYWQGTVPVGPTVAAASVDTFISDVISKDTRFRSLGASCTGNPADTMSYLDGGVAQPNEAQPASLYMRIFGPDFTDPNAGTFTPDPKVMARRSVMSSITDDRKAFTADLGADDRQRLDQFFTSVRQMEQQIDMQLTKPEPLAACVKPGAVEEFAVSDQVDVAQKTHKLMGQLLAHALLCDQTRSARIMLSGAGSNPAGCRRFERGYHTYTHQEPISGPQTKCKFFNNFTITQMAEFVKVMDSFKEGDSTLLDQSLIVFNTDNGIAFTHSLTNIPMFTAGRAGGAVKTGIHVNGNGDPGTRIGLTAMGVFKVPVNKFGTGGMETNRPISEILA